MTKFKTVLVLATAATLLIAVGAFGADRTFADSNRAPASTASDSPANQVFGSPSGVPFQGFLTDAGGIPLGTGAPVAVNVTFRFYDAAVAGTLLHSEIQAVTVSEGVFQANLSPPGDLFHGLPRFLGLVVAAGPELTPRTEILSTPFARVSQTLSGFGGVDGQLQQGGGFTELVDNTSDETLRRYYLAGAADSDWAARDGRLIVAVGGELHPGIGTVTVLRNGAIVATFFAPGPGTRAWTFIADLPALVDGETIDVLARASAAGVPLAIRNITLETDNVSVEEPGPTEVAFHAYNSALDSGLPIGWNHVEGDVERYDLGGDYDHTTDTFTAPTTGIYHFTNQVGFTSVDDGVRYAIALAVNGIPSIFTDSGYTNTTGNFQARGGSATLSLNAGDTVKSWALLTDVSHGHENESSYTYFSGHLLTTTTTTTPSAQPVWLEHAVDPDDGARR